MVIIDLIRNRFEETKLKPTQHRMFSFGSGPSEIIGCCAMGILVFDTSPISLWNATSSELVGLIKDRYGLDISEDDIQDVMSGWDNTHYDFGLKNQPLSIASQTLYKELTCSEM